MPVCVCARVCVAMPMCFLPLDWHKCLPFESMYWTGNCACVVNLKQYKNHDWNMFFWDDIFLLTMNSVWFCGFFVVPVSSMKLFSLLFFCFLGLQFSHVSLVSSCSLPWSTLLNMVAHSATKSHTETGWQIKGKTKVLNSYSVLI